MAETTASKQARNRGLTHFRLDLKTFVPYRISILATLIRRALGDVYRDDPGLTEPEWKVLTTLAHLGPLASGDIGLHMTLDRMAISRALARLIDMGLVERTPCAHDQRMTEVNLTPHGSKTFDRLAREAVAVSDSIFEPLDKAEIAELLRLIDKVENHFRAHVNPRRPTLIDTAEALLRRRDAAQEQDNARAARPRRRPASPTR